jgi:SAM-dependent methyltransferase
MLPQQIRKAMTAVLEQAPVRAKGERLDSGAVLLTDVKSRYLDGAEAGLIAKFAQVSDLSSTSDELAETAQGWAETYHLSTARANVVRCFDLPSGAKVLEIGAGCGAITRYLGEIGAIVDAVEPVPARAAVARARTADLPDVEVFIGSMDDVPAEPTYDVVIVIGVLEYVGAGTADPRPYAAFLDGIRQRLVPGGTLLLAIENKLGVKYLAGSPEDHSGRIFDGVEGYPGDDSPARTFSRHELVRMLADAGLDAASYVAFPDYKMTRTVMATDVPDELASLLYRIPNFPSPDRGVARPKLFDERAAWRSAVQAGLAGDMGNSLVLVAHKGEPQSVCWPADRIATFFSDGRAARLTMRTTVVRTDDGASFAREPLVPNAQAEKLLITSAPPQPFAPGRDLLEALASGNDERLRTLLTAWAALVRRTRRKRGAVSVDLVPHNLVVNDADELSVVDLEWRPAPIAPEIVIERGIFWLATRLAEITRPSKWPGLTTIRDLAVHLGTRVELDPDGLWLDRFFRTEAKWQARIHTAVTETAESADERRATQDAAVVATERALRHRAGVRLDGLGLGQRTHEELAVTRQSLNLVTREHAAARAELAAVRAERDHAAAELAGLAEKNIGELLDRAAQTINTLSAQLEQVQLEKRLAELQRDEALGRLTA